MSARIAALFTVFAVAGLAAAAPPEGAAKKDRDALQGVWVTDSLESMGKKARDDEVWDVLIKDDQMTLKTEGKVAAVITFKLDASLNPRLIDLTFIDGPPKGQTWEGIYAVEGDTFKLCLARMEKDRPTEFVTKPDANTVLMVFKRDKQ